MTSTGVTEDEVKESLLHEYNSGLLPHKEKTLRQWLIFTTSLTFLFFCTTLILVIQQVTAPTCSHGTGLKPVFPTDFVSGDQEIEVEVIEKNFTHDLRYNATSHTFYNQERNSNDTQYIGKPGPALDKAWHELLRSQYVAISLEEAQQFPEASRQTIDYHGQHSFFELAVYHNLHCLNELRMALDPEYYAKNSGHSVDLGGRIHLDHCVDQLRQAVECHGDLTPVPMLAVEGGPAGLFIGNGEVHTCRNFRKIQNWVEARARINRALGD